MDNLQKILDKSSSEDALLFCNQKFSLEELVIRDGQKPRFENCVFEVTNGVCIRGEGTNPVFVGCSFCSLEGSALFIYDKGAASFFESDFSCEMYSSTICVENSDFRIMFKGCQIMGFPQALSVLNCQQILFDNCTFTGSAVDEYENVIKIIESNVDFDCCDFRNVDVPPFYHIKSKGVFSNCLFREIKEIEHVGFLFRSTSTGCNDKRKIIELLDSKNPIERIEQTKNTLFDFVDLYMTNCFYGNRFHGSVWEHARQVILYVMKKDHDWQDVLVALLLEVGMKNARAEGKQKLFGFIENSVKIANAWLLKFDFSKEERLSILRILEGYFEFFELKKKQSIYYVWTFVKSPMFSRLTLIAEAECLCTLKDDGIPWMDFNEILCDARVKKCLNSDIPAPVVSRKDFSSMNWDEKQLSIVLDLCHGYQIDHGIDSKEILVNFVLERMGWFAPKME
ncbi:MULTISPECIES: hypothetical protein [unclassified Fibrobacter]|uniref:hypothetical protein n=1 Tax=unclassified Fibrobacter TaxID=2634177 RepID=UPI00091262A4|nr:MULTISPECIES: hypothetical protein [unclassified Fibrobacter]OWV01365.1 hypothetical protein B7993_15755 [Fibrobacter sp. UWH3]SHL89362.1 hypothetical protein SAMN05720765_1362 [Fibrobacter sp. UWH6]